MLTDQEIEMISKQFMSSVGDHWSSENAIREKDVDDFVSVIITAYKGKQAAAKAAPAVPVYQLAKLGGPTETAWIDVTQEVYEDAGFYKDDFKRRILYATPTPPATSLNRYRVWPDDTVQDYADGNPYNWMSDDYQLIDAETPEQALSISKGEVL